MILTPIPEQTITINNNLYTFLPDPQHPDNVEKKMGRHSTVYRLCNSQQAQYALKVFAFEWRSPSIARQMEGMNRLRSLPGMRASSCEVIKPVENADLVTSYPELRYAMLMPWIDGETWQSHVSRRQPILREQSYLLAKSFSLSVWVLEKNGFAHCDLSGENLLIDWNGRAELPGSSPHLDLIDFESVYHSNFPPPEHLPVDHSGYTLANSQGGEWSAQADRFSLALLIAEMLCWHDQTIRDAAAGDQYFDRGELQTPCTRYQWMQNSLRSNWGESITRLFEQAWCAEDLADCPACADWETALAAADPAVIARGARYSEPSRQQPPAEVAVPAFLAAERESALPQPEPTAAARPTKEETAQEHQNRRRRPQLSAAPDFEASWQALGDTTSVKMTFWQKGLGFLKDWGIILLLFVAAAFWFYKTWWEPVFIFLLAFPALTAGYIWIKWHKTIHFQWGWLVGAGLVPIAASLLPSYLYVGELYFSPGIHWLPVAGSQILIAGIFASIGQFKSSLQIRRQIPPYVLYFGWLFLASLIVSIIYGWWEYEIGIITSGAAFLLTMISCLRPGTNSAQLSEHPVSKARQIVFSVISIAILVLVSFFTYYGKSQSCTSRGALALPTLPFDSNYSINVPKGATVRTRFVSLWGDRRTVSRYYLPLRYVLVTDVSEGSPAEEAGMQEDDQVHSINGINVETVEDVIDLISSSLNQQVQIELRRDGEWILVNVTPRLIDDDDRAKIGVEIADEDSISLFGRYMWSKDLVCP